MGRALAVIAVVVVALAALGAWLFYFVGSEHPYPADVIVVLAGNPGRTSTGERLLEEGVAPQLALSVVPPLDKKLKRLCRKRAIDCFHASPESTEGEARTFARLARKRGWDRVVIVSSRFHLRRSRMLFTRCLDGDFQVVPADTSTWDFLRNLPLETGKLAVQLTVRRDC